jgi:hypothetical protein
MLRNNLLALCVCVCVCECVCVCVCFKWTTGILNNYITHARLFPFKWVRIVFYFHLFFSLFFFFFFFQYWGLDSGPWLLYHLSHVPSPFCFSYSLDKVSNLRSESFYLCLTHRWDYRLYHHALLVGWDGGSLTFCPSWPQTMFLLISPSQVASITGVNHHSQPSWWFLKVLCLELWLLLLLTIK